MKQLRTAMLLVVAGLAVFAATASAAVHETRAANGVQKKPVVKGFYKGRTVGYFDFGPIKLAPGNKLAPIWTVTNGPAGQHNIVDTVPGQSDYSPLWQVSMVTWTSGAFPRLLKSAADVQQAERAGDVTVKKTNVVVNCPVLGFGQKRVAGFSNGHVIHYYDLGPVKVAPGNVVAPLYAPMNGVPGQHNIALENVAAGQTDYPPLWGIIAVTWKASAHKTLLRSAADVKKAQAAGLVSVHKTSLVVNCPIVP